MLERYAPLFEPLAIGPVTAKNRFYQVPHCTGMGWLRPQTLAALRGVKAQGGWGVICTEYTSIHPTADDLPYPSASLWDKDDIANHRLMTDNVHEYGALAGVELWHGGVRSSNYFSREVAMDVQSLPNGAGAPWQTKAMDKADIRDLRHWHRQAALRARDAGFDIVYVYATHGYLLSNFLNPRTNTRSDEYGGSLANRVRLIRELIEDTKEAVGDRCAVAVRFAADERIGDDGKPIHGEREDMFGLLAELPDLWDINIADYSLEMGSSRFVKEGALQPYLSYIKQLTSKPVVSVGRFTSPDTMLQQIKQGVVDFIGAARPSIADPFIPNKIAAGAVEDIRECIGCNVCYAGDSLGVPIRCTQNPAIGEEWRRGWHPEKFTPAKSASSILVVGGGPAGLEAARVLGARGYPVMLAEAERQLGGRINREAKLPGLQEYVRVRDYRVQQINKLPNVEVFLQSSLSAEDVMDIGADHVLLATGATWQRQRFDGYQYIDVASAAAQAQLYSAEDVLAGVQPQGKVMIYDEDGYYLAGVIADKIRSAGQDVVLVTPADSLAPWAGHTAERVRVRRHLQSIGVEIVTAHEVIAFDGHNVELSCAYSDQTKQLPTDSLVMVCQRQPNDALFQQLQAHQEESIGTAAKERITRIGDCLAPGIIALATHAGFKYACEFDEIINDDEPLRHERVKLLG